MAFTTDTFRLYVGSAGGNKLVGEADFVKLSGSTMTGALTLSGAPTQNLHAAPKAYVDAARTGLAVKAACRVATAAALPAHGAISANVITASANGALTIDGVAVALNDRILVKDEGSGTHLENGIYYVSQLARQEPPGSSPASRTPTKARSFRPACSSLCPKARPTRTPGLC
jgi:hypothetical protein